MDSVIPFFIADDDEATANSLKKLVEKIFPQSEIFISMDGIENFEKIKKNNKQSIIIADTHLPRLGGLQLIQNIRNIQAIKNSYIIILTSRSDTESNLKALKQGADDYISKPFQMDELIGKLRSAHRIEGLQVELRESKQKIEELLKQRDNDVLVMKHNLLKLQEARFPKLLKSFEFIVEASTWVASQIQDINPDDIKIIEHAASLCFVGKLCLNEKFINEPIMRNGLLADTLMANVPVFASELVEKIRGFEEVAKILLHVFENFDGSGFPKQLRARQIPIGSRIIRVAYDHEEILLHTKGDYTSAIGNLYHENKRLYDYKIVSLFDQFLASKNISKRRHRERPIRVKDIEEGMILSRNVTTNSGLLLMSADLDIDFEKKEKIQLINKTDPIIGNIYIIYH
jgi:response regulator RpfG family c-di-GMP phosphodiesterase